MEHVNNLRKFMSQMKEKRGKPTRFEETKLTEWIKRLKEKKPKKTPRKTDRSRSKAGPGKTSQLVLASRKD